MSAFTTFDRPADHVTNRLDGPHSDQDTAAAALLAAETVRYLNYATSYGSAGLTLPGTAYALLADLGMMASRLGQLTGQVASFLDRELAAGRLGHDDGTDPGLPVQHAGGHLASAADAAAALGAALNAGLSAIACLHQTAGADAR
jgi:hypothetical protein